MTVTETATCRAGHPLEGPDADVYVPPSGRPVCRPCRRETQRAGSGVRQQRRRTIERGAWVKARGHRGSFRVHDVDDRGQVNVYGGPGERRQFHTFWITDLRLTVCPPWARDLPDPTAR